MKSEKQGICLLSVVRRFKKQFSTKMSKTTRSDKAIALTIEDDDQSTTKCTDVKLAFSLTPGSFWRLIFYPMLIFLIAYYGLSLIYDFALNVKGKKDFIDTSEFFSKNPLNTMVILILTFFTSTCLNRYFALPEKMPEISRAFNCFVTSFKENTPRGQEIVDTYGRLLLLKMLLTYRIISKPLRKLYPTLKSIEDKGLLKGDEREQLEKEEQANGSEKLPIVAFHWILGLQRLNRANFYGPTDTGRNFDAAHSFNESCVNVRKFHKWSVPSAIHQLALFAMFLYGFGLTLGRPFHDANRPILATISKYLPFHIISYLLAYAWMEIGRVTSKPFEGDRPHIDLVDLFNKQVSLKGHIAQTFGKNPYADLFAKSLEENVFR